MFKPLTFRVDMIWIKIDSLDLVIWLQWDHDAVFVLCLDTVKYIVNFVWELITYFLNATLYNWRQFCCKYIYELFDLTIKKLNSLNDFNINTLLCVIRFVPW